MKLKFYLECDFDVCRMAHNQKGKIISMQLVVFKFCVEAWRTVPPVRRFNGDKDVTFVLAPFEHRFDLRGRKDDLSVNCLQPLNLLSYCFD